MLNVLRYCMILLNCLKLWAQELESVQRKYSMHSLPRLTKLSYDKRLLRLGLSWLKQRRKYRYLEIVSPVECLLVSWVSQCRLCELTIVGNKNRSRRGCNLKAIYAQQIVKWLICLFLEYTGILCNRVPLKIRTLINRMFLNIIKVHFTI